MNSFEERDDIENKRIISPPIMVQSVTTPPSMISNQIKVKFDERRNKASRTAAVDTKNLLIPFNKPPFFVDNFSAAVCDSITAGKFSGDGVSTKKCTDFLKDRFGYDRTLLTPSCTAALEMAALILDLGPGDEVIVPSFTFVTTANAFALRGVNLIFADSEKDHPNVSVSDIMRKVTENTKAIVVVHYAGVPVDVHRILEETNHSIPIVEDCAHAIDSRDSKTGEYVGKAGCLSTFSFHETKNVGIGEGGLLVVNDEKLWRKAQITREKGTNRTDFHAGRVAFYAWVDLGSSYLMSDIDAAMLWGSLQNLDCIQKKRLSVWDAYDEKIICPQDYLYNKPSSSLRANAHMYYLVFYDHEVRSEFCKFMLKNGILVATHYIPLDKSPFVEEQRRKKALPDGELCVHAAKWSKMLVRLPLFYDISTRELERVIAAVNSYVTDIRLVAAEEKYWKDILELRNENNASFTNTNQIATEEHWNFMRKHSSTYRVAVQEGKFLGFIGHVKRDARLASNKKGKGVAKFMWESFVQEVGDLDVKVLLQNKRSLSFFSKLGYVPDAKSCAEGQNPVTLIKKNKLESIE